MSFLKTPKLASRKPQWLEEKEKEQEQRIKRALQGIRNVQSTKNPFNVMLKNTRGLGGTGSYGRSVRTNLRNLKPGFALSGLPGQGQSQPLLNSSNMTGGSL